MELVALGIDPHGDAVADVAGQQRPADTGLDLVDDEPAQRPGARDGVEPWGAIIWRAPLEETNGGRSGRRWRTNTTQDPDGWDIPTGLTGNSLPQNL